MKLSLRCSEGAPSGHSSTATVLLSRIPNAQVSDTTDDE